MTRFREWLARKWQPVQPDQLLQAYRVAFSTPEGRQVLQHLLDSIYTTVSPQSDAMALATHHGRRSVVQEILENLDRAEWPDKYQPKGLTHARHDARPEPDARCLDF